jgi:hypothetical protein
LIAIVLGAVLSNTVFPTRTVSTDTVTSTATITSTKFVTRTATVTSSISTTTIVDHVCAAAELAIDGTPNFYYHFRPSAINVKNGEKAEVVISFNLTSTELSKGYHYPYVEGNLSVEGVYFIDSVSGEVPIEGGVRWNFSSISFKAYLDSGPAYVKFTIMPVSLAKGEYFIYLDLQIDQKYFYGCEYPTPCQGWVTCLKVGETDASTTVKIIVE